MSEYPGFISKKKPNVDERIHGLDFFGIVGNGMLANEAQRNTKGLTPLNFGFDVHTGIRMSVVDGSSTAEGTETTETIRKSFGLTPLSHLDEPQMNADERRCELNILYLSDETKLATEGTENTETIRNSSGLTPLSHHQKNLSRLSVPLSLPGEFHKREVI